ncbi:MAG: hypothetical protein M0010_22890, partial [Actinomycetota bacterium]|nr:hypothetical protein [Actinomycetota bacterium]
MGVVVAGAAVVGAVDAGGVGTGVVDGAAVGVGAEAGAAAVGAGVVVAGRRRVQPGSIQCGSVKVVP